MRPERSLGATEATSAKAAHTARTVAQVRIVGSGLLGASLGQALTALGVDVVLADSSRTALSLAVDYGAGRVAGNGDNPGIIVVAVPPDVVAETVLAELTTWPLATVTDVASVKASVLRELRDNGADLSRYVGSHPMAGRERGGAVSARADLFYGRPWVLSAPPECDQERLWAVENIAADAGAVPIIMPAGEHDAAVALISHAPQVVASLLAARLPQARPETLGLAGQGLRDTVRIAASDPALWVQILGANGEAVASVLREFRDDLDSAISALAEPEAPGAKRIIAELLSRGNEGIAAVPGKHGRSERFAKLTVLVDDRPGQLAKLLTEIGHSGVNLEDLRLEHSPGAPVGLAELAVLPEAIPALSAALRSLGWRIAGGAE